MGNKAADNKEDSKAAKSAKAVRAPDRRAAKKREAKVGAVHTPGPCW